MVNCERIQMIINLFYFALMLNLLLISKRIQNKIIKTMYFKSSNLANLTLPSFDKHMEKLGTVLCGYITFQKKNLEINMKGLKMLYILY